MFLGYLSGKFDKDATTSGGEHHCEWCAHVYASVTLCLRVQMVQYGLGTVQKVKVSYFIK